jgi:hypothetical protein
MKSVFAVSGTFALLIFGPLLLDGKSVSRQHHSNFLTINLIPYLADHPTIVLLICGIPALIYNVVIFRKNAQIKQVIQINQTEMNFVFTLTNLKFKGTIEKTISIEDLSYCIESKTLDEQSKTQKLKFMNKNTQEVIGEINPQHVVWNEQIQSIRSALAYLSELGIKKTSKRSTSQSIVTSIFK